MLNSRGSMKGYRQYQCDECKEKSFHHWIELNRASRMKCPGCGCSRLELVSDEGKKDKIATNRVRLSGHRSMIPVSSRKRKIT